MTNCNCAGQCPTLKYGNRGSAVAFVQNLLRRRRYNIPVDGIFGQMTRSAVLDFQRMHSLPLTAASAYSPDRLLRRDAGVSWRVPRFWFFHGNFTAIPLVYPKPAPL